MANKQSVYVNYYGEDNKIKMLADALNRNTNDTLHDVVNVNNTPDNAFKGDLNVYPERGFDLTAINTNYGGNAYGYDSGSMLIKESKEAISNVDSYNDYFHINRKFVTFNVGGFQLKSGIEYTLEFDAQINASKFYKDPSRRLGIMIHNTLTAPYYYTYDRDAGIRRGPFRLINATDESNEIFGTYYDDYTVSAYVQEGTIHSIRKVKVHYQSLYRDNSTHHYTCPIFFEPEEYGNVYISLVFEDFLYTIDGNLHYQYPDYDESLNDLIAITNMGIMGVVTGNIPRINKYFTGSEWAQLYNPGTDSFYSNNKPSFDLGHDRDIFVELTEPAVISDLEEYPIQIQFYTSMGKYYEDLDQAIRVDGSNWKYNHDAVSTLNGISFSISGFNTRAFNNYDVGTVSDKWGNPYENFNIIVNEHSSLNFSLANVTSNQKYYIEFNISTSGSFSIDDIISRYDRLGYVITTKNLINAGYYILEQYSRGCLIEISGASGSTRLFIRDGDTLVEVNRTDYYTGRYSTTVSFNLDLSPLINVMFNVDAKSGLGYSGLADLQSIKPTGESGYVYLVGDPDHMEDPLVQLTRYYWDGSQYSTSPNPSDLMTINFTNLKVSTVLTYNEMWYKYDGHWISRFGGSGGGGSSVSITPALDTGTKIADFVIDGQSGELFAPAGGSSELQPATRDTLGGIKVGNNLQVAADGTLSAPTPGPSVTPNASYTQSNPILSSLKIDNSTYRIPAPESVSYVPIVTTGTLIGNLVVGNTTYPIYAPEGGGGGGGNEPLIRSFSVINKIKSRTEFDIGTDIVSYTPISVYLIPPMASNTSPSGVSSASSGTSAYLAFDGINCSKSTLGNGWLPSTSDTTPYLQYTWDSVKELSMLHIETCNNKPDATRTIIVEGLTSNNTWENCLASGNNTTLDFINGYYTQYDIPLNGHSYMAIRISGNESWYDSSTNGFACCISEMQVKYIASI